MYVYTYNTCQILKISQKYLSQRGTKLYSNCLASTVTQLISLFSNLSLKILGVLFQRVRKLHVNVIHAKKVKVLDVRGSYAQEDKLTSPTYCTKFFIFMRESFCNVLVRYCSYTMETA